MIGPAKSYCTAIDEALKAAYLEEQSKKSFYPLRPSSAGYCARKLAYELNAYKGNEEKFIEDRKASVIRLLSLGHSIEWHVIKYMDKMADYKVKYKQQAVSMFKLDSGQLIEGSLDGVLWSDQYRAVMDVKSVGTGWSKGYKSRWDEMLAKYDGMTTMKKFDENAYYIEDVMAWLDEVGEDTLVTNVFQLNLYACTDFLKERNIDHAVLMRYCKNDSRHHEVRFKPSDELVELVRQKFNIIDEATSRNKPDDVPREYALGSYSCAYCPYQERCWGEGTRADKEYYKTQGPKYWAKRLSDLNDPKLTALFDQYLTLEKTQSDLSVVEGKILTALSNKQIRKVKLDKGDVFEVKQYKSPKPRLSLQRGKE